MESPHVRPSILQEKVGGKIRCEVCERRCLIVEGGLGWCRTRIHRKGRLLTTIYGLVSSLAANPIEKKPFYHFHPGTEALTAGSWSCNFGCPWCQNWGISKAKPPYDGEYMSPERFIDLTEAYDCQGTSISFNEPVLSLEWSLDAFRLGKDRGLYNTYVTNGYMTAEAFDCLVEAGLQAMNVDIKGDAEAVRHHCRGIDVEKVWETCRRGIRQGVHVELTTLVIPGVNDGEASLRGIAQRVASDLGGHVPWHVSAYYPAYRFSAPPTPVATLELAWEIGRDAGLQFVYVGNIPGHRRDNTYCPECSHLLIERHGFDVVSNSMRSGHCPHCGVAIPGVW